MPARAVTRLRARGQALSLAALAALWPGLGCGGDDHADEPEPEPEPEIDPRHQVEAALADIHDALPGDLAEAVRFHTRALEGGELYGALPEGWESGHLDWSLRPPEDADLGFQTQYGVGFGCAGACEPKDWDSAIVHTEFAQYRASERFEILRDERIGRGSRIVTALRNETIYVTAAWWQEGASRYAFCRATLDGPAAEAREAFERACLATHPEL